MATSYRAWPSVGNLGRRHRVHFLPAPGHHFPQRRALYRRRRDRHLGIWQGESSAWPDRYTIAETVEKIDDYTVKVTTDGPKPLLLVTMHDFWSIIPNEYMAEVGVDGFQEHPIGTGPFMFVEWVKGDHITYKANPNYWREGMPKVETLIFRPSPSPQPGWRPSRRTKSISSSG
jgi:ABC-type transport system substrate-binding protein